MKVGGVLARILVEYFVELTDADEEGRLYAHSRVYLEVSKDNLSEVHNLRHQ